MTYTISLNGSEGTTYMEVEMNDEQLRFVKHLRRLAMIGQQSYAPSISIYEGGVRKIATSPEDDYYYLEPTGKEIK